MQLTLLCHSKLNIIVDTALRRKRNFKHEKQLSQQYRHIIYCHFGMHDQGLPAARLTSTVRNVKITLFEKIVLLLHPHVDVPYRLVVT